MDQDTRPVGFADSWFVSWHNFSGEESAPFKLHDVTLRDGEQQAGVIFTGDEKIEIAQSLARLGVDRIEGGMLAVSREDRETLRRLVELNLGPEIWGVIRSIPLEVEQAIEVGVQGVGIILLANDQYCKVFNWTPEAALEMALDTARAAKEGGLQTTLLIADASRMTAERLSLIVAGATKSGTYDALALMDTFGALNPGGTDSLVRSVRQLSDLEIEFHAHNDFGMGTANAIASIDAGAAVVHASVLGIGERVGNAPLEEVVMAASALRNQKSHLDLSYLHELTDIVRRCSGVEIADNKAIAGASYSRIESGAVATEFTRLRNAGEAIQWILPYDPALIGGHGVELVLGKGSGAANVEAALVAAGLSMDESQRRSLLNKLKAVAIEKHRLLTADEFKCLAIENGATRNP